MRLNNNSWLLNKPIAHRGLWGGNIVENSITAYQNAIDNGYPIEIDVYRTLDGKLVSFHDSTLKRMTGIDGKVYEKSFDQLKTLNLANSNEKIPLLEDVLALCENKTPLLIEFKDQPSKDFVKDTVSMLKKYKGEFAVQSFNPLYINQIKKLAPEFIRGILATESHADDKSFLTRYVLKNMSFNGIIKPDFISYSYTGLPLKAKKVKNLPVIAWTVTDQQSANTALEHANNIIFEHFIPNR